MSELERLREENKALRSELEHIKAELEGRKRGRSSQKDKYAEEFEKLSRNESLFSKKNYFSFLLNHISHTSIFHLYKRMVSISRKYALVSTSLKIAAVILAILQTSTIFVLATSVFIVSLPFTFIIGYSVFILTLFGRRRVTKMFKASVENKNITVLIPPRGRAFERGSFFRGMANDYASDENNFVIIVSPYFLSSKGVGEKRSFFPMARFEKDNLVIVRRHYFFALKKFAKKTQNNKLTFIH